MFFLLRYQPRPFRPAGRQSGQWTHPPTVFHSILLYRTSISASIPESLCISAKLHLLFLCIFHRTAMFFGLSPLFQKMFSSFFRCQNRPRSVFPRSFKKFIVFNRLSGKIFSFFRKKRGPVKHHFAHCAAPPQLSAPRRSPVSPGAAQKRLAPRPGWWYNKIL